MDPTACLERMLRALTDDDRDEAVGAMEDLAGWICSGGFMPDVPKALDRVASSIVARRLAALRGQG